MRPIAFVCVLVIAACSSDRLVRPEAARPASAIASFSDGTQPPPCKLTTPLSLYVRAKSLKGDGSFAAPFGTIGDALAAGSAQSACYLRVLLRGGTFSESFVVPVPHLEVASVGGSNTMSGTITSSGRWLEIRGVTIAVRGDVGVRQAGGRLQLAGVSVTGARADPKSLDSGIGLWISDGAQATLDLVVFDGNGSQALRLEGPGTEAWLTGVFVTNTGIHPGELARLAAGTATDDDHVGAVEVSQGAKAIIKFSGITGSMVSALDVSHGAQALLQRTSVTRTAEATLGTYASGAYNVISRNGATVETFHLLTRDADFDLTARDDAWLTMHYGVVGGAAVGLVLHNLTPVPGYSPTTCATLDHTIYTDVGVPLEADYYPPPGTPSDPSLCRHVTDDVRPF